MPLSDGTHVRSGSFVATATPLLIPSSAATPEPSLPVRSRFSTIPTFPSHASF